MSTTNGTPLCRGASQSLRMRIYQRIADWRHERRIERQAVA